MSLDELKVRLTVAMMVVQKDTSKDSKMAQTLAEM